MTLVMDASAIVAALVDDGPDGHWAETVIASEPLAAPHLMPVEVANILRRAVLAGQYPSMQPPWPMMTCSSVVSQ
jgi:predicted nucleic acid-binding protein